MATTSPFFSYTVVSIAGTAGTLHTWRPSSGAPLRSQTACNINSSSCVAHTPTRIFALTQNSSKTTASLSTFLTSRNAGGPLHRVSLPSPQCCAIAISTSGSFLALGDSNGVLFVHHLATGTMFCSLPTHFRGISRIAFSDDDELLLTAGVDGEVHAFALSDLVDVTRPKDRHPKARISLHAHSLPCVALSVGFGGASARVLTAGKDRSARLWHLSSGRCIAVVLFEKAPTEAVMSLDESACYVGLSSGEVVVLDVATLPDTPVSASGLPKIRPPLAPDEQPSAVTALTVSPSGRDVIVGYSNGVVRVYDTWSRQLLSTYTRHGTTAAIDSVCILPGDQAAVQTSRDAGKNEAEVSVDRAVDPDLVANFEPIVALPGRKTVRAAALEITEDAATLAFVGVELRTQPGVCEDVSGQNENYASTEEGRRLEEQIPSTVPTEILRELENLRKRNEELEEAGRRLLKLVDPTST